MRCVQINHLTRTAKQLLGYHDMLCKGGQLRILVLIAGNIGKASLVPPFNDAASGRSKLPYSSNSLLTAPDCNAIGKGSKLFQLEELAAFCDALGSEPISWKWRLIKSTMRYGQVYS